MITIAFCSISLGEAENHGFGAPSGQTCFSEVSPPLCENPKDVETGKRAPQKREHNMVLYYLREGGVRKKWSYIVSLPGTMLAKIITDQNQKHVFM